MAKSISGKLCKYRFTMAHKVNMIITLVNTQTEMQQNHSYKQKNARRRIRKNQEIDWV